MSALTVWLAASTTSGFADHNKRDLHEVRPGNLPGLSA